MKLLPFIKKMAEQRGQLPEAIGQYKAAHELEGPQKWSDEAKAALIRLQQHPPRSSY
jgi:hypothetical protein